MTAEDFAAVRARVNLSHAALARLLQCHPKTVYQMETGLRGVPPSVARWLEQLARWYDSHPAPADWRVK